MTEIIAKKRDKHELSHAEINFFVSGVTDGSIPDYQISALLMAIYLNGMSESETAELTLAMANSGDMVDLSALGDFTVDKHSTGGVGDKTTLICAPIAAVLGCKVAKMSGRSLGHTGGTVDKLESITGYKTSVPESEFIENTRKNGLCLAGHSGNFAPADKRIYAIRDVTSTVESIPLIASSIMSKKLASGAKSIVLDVKYGSGAFMKTKEDAEKLAFEMVKIGKNTGRKTCALITDMDIPLGRAVGNILEIKEACEVLRGGGDKRLRELCITLAADMYSLSFGIDFNKAFNAAEKALSDGSALEKLCDAVRAQGGDTDLITGKKQFSSAEAEFDVFASSQGYICKINSETVGRAALLSGAGRETLDSEIDNTAGIILHKKYGEFVKQGEKVATVYGKPQKLEKAAELLSSAFDISDHKPPERALIYKRIV